MQQQIYWHTTIPTSDPQDLHRLPQKVDIAVIGGGYTGLSAARTLALQGVIVAVLEAQTMGWGASSRNGGMVLSGLKLPMQTTMKRYGKELAKMLFQVSLDSIDTVEQLIRKEQIECGFVRSGHLMVANKPSHFKSLMDEVEFMEKEFNHKVRLIPRQNQQEEIGTELFHGALVDEASGGLNPAQFVSGLARAAERAGAILCAQAGVTRIERRQGRFVIETTRGRLNAESVLVATSGYTGRATRSLQKKIIPIGSFIIATERIPDDLTRELSPKNRMIFDTRHYLNYFRLWDNRMIFGGRAAFFPENQNTIQQSARILQRELIRIFPKLKNLNVEYAWGGTLDFAFDMMTHVGEIDGLVFSLGYAGHGVAMGTHLGQTVAQAMTQGTLRDHPFAMIGFPGAPLGLYNGYPWFLPLAGLWYKLLDWVE